MDNKTYNVVKSTMTIVNKRIKASGQFHNTKRIISEIARAIDIAVQEGRNCLTIKIDDFISPGEIINYVKPQTNKNIKLIVFCTPDYISVYDGWTTENIISFTPPQA